MNKEDLITQNEIVSELKKLGYEDVTKKRNLLKGKRRMSYRLTRQKMVHIHFDYENVYLVVFKNSRSSIRYSLGWYTDFNLKIAENAKKGLYHPSNTFEHHHGVKIDLR